MALEDIVQSFATIHLEKDTVILCDRGLMDGKAYCDQELWQAVLDELGSNDI